MSYGLASATGTPACALHFNAGPTLEHLHDGGEVFFAAELFMRLEPGLAHRVRPPHRNAGGFRLLEAELEVLVHEVGGEAEVEAARQDRLWELVLRSAVPAAAGVDDVDHDRRIETGLDPEHHRFAGGGERGRGKEIVGELHRLAHAGALADEEDPAEMLE